MTNLKIKKYRLQRGTERSTPGCCCWACFVCLFVFYVQPIVLFYISFFLHVESSTTFMLLLAIVLVVIL